MNMMNIKIVLVLSLASYFACNAFWSQQNERLKNLRACYTRHLKNKSSSGSGAKSKRPYYLSEHLQFLDPFKKTRKHTVEQSELAENINENVLDGNDFLKDYPDTDEEELFEDVEDSQPVKIYTKKPTLKKKRQSAQFDEVNKAAFDYFISKKEKKEPEEDADLCFLKSLLPDMRKMNDEQKRRYKIHMICIAGSILSEQNIPCGPKTPSIQQQPNLNSNTLNSLNIPTIVGIPIRPQPHPNEASEAGTSVEMSADDARESRKSSDPLSDDSPIREEDDDDDEEQGTDQSTYVSGNVLGFMTSNIQGKNGVQRNNSGYQYRPVFNM